MACQVIDWAMQAHGGGGMCDDFPWPTPTPVRAPCALPTARTKCTATPLPNGSWAKYGSYGRDAGVPITRGA